MGNNSFYDSSNENTVHFIKPGEFHFCGDNAEIHTLLGSCIAITLWHPELRIGGMCHFVLPCNSKRENWDGIEDKYDGRYATGAMALFERETARHNSRLIDYQAKIFGGSNMLHNTTLREDEMVGTRNTVAAVTELEKRKIPLLVAHVGETGHRRIIFDLNNGNVWVKHQPLQKLIPNRDC